MKPLRGPGFMDLTGKGANAMRKALDKGPIAASLWACDDFQAYRVKLFPGDVYYKTKGGNCGGHAVELVGYGWYQDQPYWLVRSMQSCIDVQCLCERKTCTGEELLGHSLGSAVSL